MPAITDYIAAACPALAASASLNVYIADAQNRTNQAAFGVNYAKAVALRAMHEFTLDQRATRGFDAPGGAVSSLREGGSSVSFATDKGHQLDVDLEQTSFGKRLRALIRSLGPAASVMGFNSVAAAGMPVRGDASEMIANTNDFTEFEDF